MNEVTESPRGCSYCGLPVARREDYAAPSPIYCCLGCQLADAIVREKSETGQARWTLIRLGLAIFFSMNVMVFTMALWSWDAYEIESSPASRVWHDLLRYACLLFAAPVVLLLGEPLVESAWQALRTGRLTTDVLLLMGVVAAFLYSIVSLLTGQPHVYFEVACMILVAVTIGRWLEATGKQRAMKSLQSLQRLLPETVRLVSRAHGADTPPPPPRISSQEALPSGKGPQHDERELPLEDAVPGDVLRALPGERIPLDGRITSGRAFVDEQLITGESQPASRETGDAVFGGSLNVDGELYIEVTRPAAAGVIQRLIEAVRTAAQRPSRPQRLADRLVSWFVPAVAVIVVGTFWYHAQHGGMSTALMAAMSVALIACPCALAIATPLAVWAALGVAARNGVIFRSGDALDRLAHVDTACLDKTGTITTGSPRVASTYLDRKTTAADVNRVALALAVATSHPMATALADHLRAAGVDSVVKLQDPSTTPGRGVTATLTGTSVSGVESPTRVVMGNLRFVCDSGIQIANPAFLQYVETAVSRGHGMVCLGWGERLRGAFAFDESLRPTAEATIAALQQAAVDVRLLTGDHAVKADRLAQTLGIQVAANLLPEDKLHLIQELQKDRHTVMMVGDGINDAPAMVGADVGVALGCGADLSRDAADICLLGSDLTMLNWSMELANRARRTIRRNLVWAVGYNIVGIGLAAGGYLNPILAAGAMVLSSGLVIAESIRLSTFAAPSQTPGQAKEDSSAGPPLRGRSRRSLSASGSVSS